MLFSLSFFSALLGYVYIYIYLASLDVVAVVSVLSTAGHLNVPPRT